jgi:hypothetical protein
MQVIELKSREVYGKVLLYPTCDLGRALCAFKGSKTLTPADISTLNRGGLYFRTQEHDSAFIGAHPAPEHDSVVYGTPLHTCPHIDD